MDYVFGKDNFNNEIIWHYGGGGASKKKWGKKHDIILFYARGNNWMFNIDNVREKYKWDKGQTRADGSQRDYNKGKIPDDVFHLHSLLPWAKEGVGYPTQKPLALLERIIKASSNKGDLVLDPFCGCATTCVASEINDRQWIGIDINPQAFYLNYYRLYTQRITKLNPDVTTPDIDVYLERVEETNYEDLEINTKEKKEKGKGLTRKERDKLFPIIYKRDEGYCQGCLQHFDEPEVTLDHIHPISKEGSCLLYTSDAADE